MTRFRGYKKLLGLFFPFILLGIAAAVSPDPRLLPLVPPGAQLVAGIVAPSTQGQPDNFVLMTHNNTVDLEDFFALTGADSSRIIHQIVFVAQANNDGQPNEHSLLVSGHFDQPQIFKSAADGGAAATNYRGIRVLEIQPFARERGMFNEVRWLAVLDSNVLVFGSVASTRQELDRYLAHSRTDENLLRRLAHLRGKDQSWCVLSASIGTLASPARDQEIHSVLATLNPELAELAKLGEAFEFGLHYGRHVEFEYEVTKASTRGKQSDSAPFAPSSAEPIKSASLLPSLNIIGDGDTLHGVIEVSLSRYEEWLAQIRRSRSPLG